MANGVAFCARCGLPVSKPVLVRTIRGQEKAFCCHRCLSLYDAAQRSEALKRFPTISSWTWQKINLPQSIVAFTFGISILAIYFFFFYSAYNHSETSMAEGKSLHYLVWALATPALFYGGLSFPLGAWRAARAGFASMDTLLTASTYSIYGYSVYATLTGHGRPYFDAVAVIVTLITVVRCLESFGTHRASQNIRRLLKLQPTLAWKRTTTGCEQVETSSLQVGDLITIKSGERAPVDCLILEGYATVNESLFNDERTPEVKGPGQTIFAGALITEGTFDCWVTGSPDETRLAHIVRSLERSMFRKEHSHLWDDRSECLWPESLGRNQQNSLWDDRTSSKLILAVFVVAAATAMVWWDSGHSLPDALLTAITVLTVASPGALALATPLALTIAVARASTDGILIRYPEVIETISDINRIVFSKTGVLTRGHLTVQAVIPSQEGDLSQGELLAMAAAVEQHSDHPLANAILAVHREPLISSQRFQNTPGFGVSAWVKKNGYRRVQVGSLRFMETGAPGFRLMSEAQDYINHGDTVIWVRVDREIAGFIVLRDQITSTARPALRQLHACRPQTVVLSGDHPTTTEIVASQIGVEDYQGHCTSYLKTGCIRRWQEKGQTVAVVGNERDDVSVLDQANISIAVVANSDIISQSSDVILTGPDLTSIPNLIHLARLTQSIVTTNLIWTFTYNLVAIPLAALDALDPFIAALAMLGNCLLVVLNSLSLLRTPAKHRARTGGAANRPLETARESQSSGA